MIFGQVALVVAALFAGAAVYITVAEHPARLRLADGPLLAQWQPAYQRGFMMQGSLAVVAFLIGMTAWWQTKDWRWALGACVMVTNWPYTVILMMPTNKALMAMDPARPGSGARLLIQKWGTLHAVRTGLGFTATAIFLWASLR